MGLLELGEGYTLLHDAKSRIDTRRVVGNVGAFCSDIDGLFPCVDITPSIIQGVEGISSVEVEGNASGEFFIESTFAIEGLTETTGALLSIIGSYRVDSTAVQDGEQSLVHVEGIALVESHGVAENRIISAVLNVQQIVSVLEMCMNRGSRSIGSSGPGGKGSVRTQFLVDIAEV